MSIKRFKMNKLIRDRIPNLMLAKGIVMHNVVMDQEEFIQKLKDKLLEECQETIQSHHPEELIEELADVLEVISALSAALDSSMEQVEEKRIEKRKQKGGFEERLFNHHVEIDEDNPAITYLSHTKQYPQIYDQGHEQECLFCQMACGKREGELFAKFQHCYIIKDQFPVSPGHLLIIPYTHTENWFTASEEVRLDIFKALNYAKEKLDQTYKPHGYNIGANCGEAAGQSVMHLHVHLIPRYQGDMDNPKGGVRGVIPARQKY